MSKIYQFPIVNLRQEISNGHVSEGTKELIRSVLVDLTEFNPDSWDRRFCESLLTYTEPLSDKQIDHLERILEEILTKTEHPSFTPKVDFSVLDDPADELPESKPPAGEA